jgi:atypical dual specificity phosphatase
MNTDFNVCKDRIKNRVGHKIDNDGTKILDGLKDKLEIPNNITDSYATIEIINEDNIDDFYNKYGIEIDNNKDNNEPFIIKFCRTRHLLNLGSATRDDLIMTVQEQSEFLNREISIEEKIDGANLGFSIKDGKITAQNRSHYVNASSHVQFKDIDKFIMKHSEELYEILEDGKYILYGEWLYAKHSIHYTNLPDCFIAFDLYNIKEKKFVSRNKLEEKLKNMFRDIQAPFARHLPDDRKNFLSYSYVLYKFCELLGEDDFLPCFPLLKSKEKLYQQDVIWKKICEELQWEYISTI